MVVLANYVLQQFQSENTSRIGLIAGAPFLYHRRFQLWRAYGINGAVSEIPDAYANWLS